ncbi:MAG: hypothetical protein ABID71_09495, partial [Chloroflexota bacterium]
MRPIPGEPQHIGEEPLREPVAAKDARRLPLAIAGEAREAVRVPLQQPAALQGRQDGLRPGGGESREGGDLVEPRRVPLLGQPLEGLEAILQHLVGHRGGVIVGHDGSSRRTTRGMAVSPWLRMARRR